MKLTIKAKDFISIYTSGAEQFSASPAESHPRARPHVHAPTCSRAALGVGEASASEAPDKDAFYL